MRSRQSVGLTQSEWRRAALWRGVGLTVKLRDCAMPYKDPEKRRKYVAEWAKANKDKCDAARKKWKEKNPEKDRDSKRNWKQRNPEKVLARSRRAIKNLGTEYIKLKIVQHSKIRQVDVPMCLVDAHRELLRIKRELWKCKTARN